jgi:hypothetical protein
MCCIAVHERTEGRGDLDAVCNWRVQTVAKIEANPLLAPLRVEDFQGKEALVCRVKDAKVNVPSEKGKRGKATFLELWEFPGKGLYLNATSQQHAVEGFGSDETDNWKDKLVPVVVVNAEYKDPKTLQVTVSKVLWVAPAANWKMLLRSAPKAETVTGTKKG